MISLIMIAVTLVLVIAGFKFMFRKHGDNINGDNINGDNIKRDTKVAVIFIILAIVTAVTAVILAILPSGAPLP